jgi:hypothetical protein
MTTNKTPHSTLPGRTSSFVTRMSNRQNAQGIGGARSVLCARRKEWSEAEPRKARLPHRGNAPNINSSVYKSVLLTPHPSLKKKDYPHV